MDDIARYNEARWEALVRADALFTRPKLGLDAEGARALVDPEGRLGDLAGQRVLCLSGGGGQQSVAFALLGAEVTVLDLSAAQLERDRLAAASYGFQVTLQPGDIRDLSRFAPASFDVVYHAYSLNFVPDPRVVFAEVARVLRPGGLYRFNCANPFVAGMGTRDWTGEGYLLRRPYVEGQMIEYPDEPWVYAADASQGPIPPVREYRHTHGMLTRSLLSLGFTIEALEEQEIGPPDADPGSWEHFVAYAPPWLVCWARLLR